MKRTKTNKKADLILSADWHLRESTPICRTDDFWHKQWQKVKFISDLQKEHDCSVIHAGDLFDHWKPSPYLLSVCMAALPKQFYTVYGNHDLPQHSMELRDKSGVFTLQQAQALKVLDNCHWNQDPETVKFPSIEIKDKTILIWHIFTYQAKTWPGNTAPKAAKLLRKYPEYDLIVTGDNHQAFVEEHQGRLLVNPGSLSRQDSDQIDFRPRVYLYYADTNTVEPVYLPIDPGVVSREHLEKQEERNDRISAFISKLNTDYESSVSFEANLKQFIANNVVHTDIQSIIQKSME